MDLDAKKILNVDGDGKLRINQSEISKLLKNNERKSKVVSIFGTTRAGKSYIMNVIKKKLEGYNERALRGFESQNGTSSVTKGFWCIESFEKYDRSLSYLLCDTEGAFEMGKHTEIAAKLMAVSAIVSDCLIINIRNLISANEINFFNAFLNQANFENSRKFNQLLFLIRNWESPDQYEFGLSGGRKYLDSLKNESTLQNIIKMFNVTDCFLMPPIGIQQARSKNYNKIYEVAKDTLEECTNGEVVTQEFNEHVNELITYIVNDIRSSTELKYLEIVIKGMVNKLNSNEQIHIYDLQTANEEIIEAKKKNEELNKDFAEQKESLIRQLKAMEKKLENISKENEKSKHQLDSLAKDVHTLQIDNHGLKIISKEKEEKIKQIENSAKNLHALQIEKHKLELDLAENGNYVEYIERKNEELERLNEEYKQKCEGIKKEVAKTKPGPGIVTKVLRIITSPLRFAGGLAKSIFSPKLMLK